MGTNVVVVLPPDFDDRRGLGAGAKPLHAQALVAEAAIGALVGAVLPGLAGIDERVLDAVSD